jgi:anti-sigma factor RsiW
MTRDEPEPQPDDRPEQPVRGARWAHERVAGRSAHDRSSRSGEPEAAMRESDGQAGPDPAADSDAPDDD